MASENLRAARLRVGLSQREAARRSGVSQQTISFAEAGKHTPTGATLASLLDVYGERELAASIRQYLPPAD